jgi:hypothetical protein
MMRGFNSLSSGALRLIDMVWPLDVGAPITVAHIVVITPGKTNQPPRFFVIPYH